MEKITILLVDDHKLIRETWSLIFNSEPLFQVVGDTGDANEAIRLAMEKKPRIVLVDINMTPTDGFEVTRLIRKYAPGSKIIGLSGYCIPAYARKIMKLGAMGYVTKNSPRLELISAIAAVNSGNKYICLELKDMLANDLECDEKTPTVGMLSTREIDVVKLIKNGLSSKEIAGQLAISLKTVEVHRYNILRKLKLRNTASLVNFSHASGL